MGTAHLHLVATQGGDARRMHVRRRAHERGLLTLRMVTSYDSPTGRAVLETTALAPVLARVECMHRCVECI